MIRHCFFTAGVYEERLVCQLNFDHMLVIGLSLPGMIILKKVVKLPLILIFVGVAGREALPFLH